MRLVSILMVSLTLTSCKLKSLKPFIEYDELVSPKTGQRQYAEGLDVEIDAVMKKRRELMEAAGKSILTRNAVALATTSTAMAATFLAITSGSRASKDFITGTGVATAGILGLGTFFGDDWKRGVYLEGARALGCSLLAMRPLMIPNDEYDEFEAARQHLTKNLTSLEANLEEIQNLIHKSSSSNQDVVQFAHLEMNAGQRLLRRARDVADGGRRLRAELRQARLKLRLTAADIIDDINKEIDRNEPDFSTITRILDRVSALQGQTSPVPQTGTPTDAFSSSGLQGTEVHSLLKSAINKMNQTSVDIVNYMSKVSDYVNQVSEDQAVVGSIDNCRFNSTIAQLEISPKDTAVTLTAGKPGHRFSVFGGTGAPRVYLNGTDFGDTVTVTPAGFSPDSYDYILQANESAPAGRAEVLILDASGSRQKRIDVTALAKPTESVTPASSSDDAAANNSSQSASSYEQKLEEYEVMLVQLAVGLGVYDDRSFHRIGPKTRKGIKNYWETSNGELKRPKGVEETQLTQTLFEHMKEKLATQDPAFPLDPAKDRFHKPLNQIEDDLSEDNFRTIRTKLRDSVDQLPGTGKFDKELRGAILAYQRENKLPRSGFFDCDLADKLLEVTPDSIPTCHGDRK